MTERITPYGSWKSPITSDLIVAATVRLGEIGMDRATGDIYWIEGRPTEGGRSVLVRRSADGRREDVTPPPFNVRSRVHEYGGGAYLVHAGHVFFANFADQRVYHLAPDAQAPQPITPELPPPAQYRYADFVLDETRGRLICVREEHPADGREAVNTLVALDITDNLAGGRVLVSGNDFYASPRLSSDGARLAWLTWRHPNMPWDGCELWVGEIGADGAIQHAEQLAGAPEESIFQPEWSPGGELYFVSDRTGWWNLYRLRDGEAEALAPLEAEFGLPQWVFGMSTYAFESAGRIVCAYTQDGVWHLATLDVPNGMEASAGLSGSTHRPPKGSIPGDRLQPLATPYTDISDVRAAPGRAVFMAASPTEADAVVQLDLATGQVEVLRRSSDAAVDARYLSVPRAIEFPTEGGLTAHGLFYAPHNADYAAPEGERPPLIVLSHGGPTGATSSALSLGIQYWTSRGFAVLDVNYGGSTGYGRAYRERLNDNWGVVDVDDCANGAAYLIEQGLVDGDRLAIKGGSAGGYTTLAALTFRDVFKAGASYYGIGDLETLATDTHKFESRYLDHLIGPYPDRKDLYVARSPIHFTDRLACALILFQGLDDKVVPPNQAETMFVAVRNKELPTAYLAYEGEGHGFRRAENIKRSLDAELYFYSRIFGFKLAEPVEPVQIENL